MQGGLVESYPWRALDVLSRQTVARVAGLGQLVRRAVRPQKLAAALGQVVACEAVVVVQRVAARRAPACLPAAQVRLRGADECIDLRVGVEPRLATAVLSRVLGRPIHLEPPDLPLEPELSGALAAMAIEVARATGATQALKVAVPDDHRTADDGLEVEATVLLDGLPYRAGLWLEGRPRPTGLFAARPTLAQIGAMPVSVPVVGGICLATRTELEQLRIGDAWLCGEGWLVDANGLGDCALAAPTGELGARATLRPDGGLLLDGGSVPLGQDEVANEIMSDPNDTLVDAVLDAPVVVRVELGAVSMTAREWAALGPGDVILAGRRVAEPALLRVAGREVARGELVNVDGELGVRIQSIDTGVTDP